MAGLGGRVNGIICHAKDVSTCLLCVMSLLAGTAAANSVSPPCGAMPTWLNPQGCLTKTDTVFTVTEKKITKSKNQGVWKQPPPTSWKIYTDFLFLFLNQSWKASCKCLGKHLFSSIATDSALALGLDCWRLKLFFFFFFCNQVQTGFFQACFMFSYNDPPINSNHHHSSCITTAW